MKDDFPLTFHEICVCPRKKTWCCQPCNECNNAEKRITARESMSEIIEQYGKEAIVNGEVVIRGTCPQMNDLIKVERSKHGIVVHPKYLVARFVYENMAESSPLVEPEPQAQSKIALPGQTGSLGVFVERKKARVSSKAVAEAFEKRHDNVIRAIKTLDCTANFRHLNFEETFESVVMPNFAIRQNPMYLMTRDGFTFLAMGFTGPKAARFKEAYINEFNRMEEELRREPLLPEQLERAYQEEMKLNDECMSLIERCDVERKRAATAIGNVRAARSSEQKMRHQLNKALEALANLRRN